jgi:heme oxygenase (biliverdin-IX-beta and delta-forming)
MRRGPLLRALRDATSALHCDVERMLPPFDSLSEAGYAAHLAALAGFHLPLEQRLFAAHDWSALGLPDAAERPRGPLLEADLRRLGIDPCALPRCRLVPDVTALPRALGAMYVLEGSRLGGQVLARQVARAAGHVPTRFLAGAGARTGARWASFCRFAEERAAAPCAIEQAAAAAVDCFAALAIHLAASEPVAPVSTARASS